MASDDEPKPRSLRDIAARAKEAAARQSTAPPAGDTADLLGALQGRPSVPPASLPPGTLPSVPPPATGERASLSVPPAARLPTTRSSGLPPPPARVPGLAPPSRPPASFPGAAETQRAPATSLAVGAPEIAAAFGPPPAGASAGEPRPPVPVSTVGVQMTTTEGGRTQDEARRSMLPVLAAVGALAIAGLVVVMLRQHDPLTLPAGAASGASAGASVGVVASAPASASAPATSDPAPAASAAASGSAGSVDINALSSADTATQVGRAPVGQGSAAPVASVAPAASVTAAVSAAPRPMGSVGDLQDEMRKRVGATDPGAAPEQATPSGGNPDAKQEKPSTAAVSGALGAVRGAVKACLADTDKPTRVGVVFQSDGSVRSVSVSGGAAGKADACVIAAVKKARVAPFMADSFSTSFSVSP